MPLPHQPNRIADVRKERGLTQQQLADRLGVHWITISKLERGVTQLTIPWLDRLSSVLNCDMSDLLLLANREPLSVAVAGIIVGGQRVTEVPDAEVEYQAVEQFSVSLATKWCRVADNALLPFFAQGDLLAFADLAPIDFHQHEGRVVCVEREGGTVLGVLEKADENNASIRLFNGLLIPDFPYLHAFVFMGCYIAGGFHEVGADYP